MKTHLIVIDTETGGLDPDRNALLAIAAVDGRTEECFHRWVKPAPGWRVEPEALEVIGVDLRAVETMGMPEGQALADLTEWLRYRPMGVTVAGHHVAFDVGFLKAAYGRYGMPYPFSHRTLDLRGAAWLAWERGDIVLPERGAGPDFSLDGILSALGLERSADGHCAKEDAELTLEAFRVLARGLTEKQEAVAA